MKRLITLLATAFLFVSFTFAGSTSIPLDYHRRTTTSGGPVIDRAPETPPVEVTIDSANLTITVSGDPDVHAEVFLFNSQQVVIDYSPEVNVCFQVDSQAEYILKIDSEYWEATALLKL